MSEWSEKLRTLRNCQHALFTLVDATDKLVPYQGETRDTWITVLATIASNLRSALSANGHPNDYLGAVRACPNREMTHVNFACDLEVTLDAARYFVLALQQPRFGATTAFCGDRLARVRIEHSLEACRELEIAGFAVVKD